MTRNLDPIRAGRRALDRLLATGATRLAAIVRRADGDRKHDSILIARVHGDAPVWLAFAILAGVLGAAGLRRLRHRPISPSI